MGTFRKKLTMLKHRKMAKKLEAKAKAAKPSVSPGHAVHPPSKSG